MRARGRSWVHLHYFAVAVEKILCQAKEQVVIVAAVETQLRAQQHSEMLLLKFLAAAVALRKWSIFRFHEACFMSAKVLLLIWSVTTTPHTPPVI